MGTHFCKLLNFFSKFERSELFKTLLLNKSLMIQVLLVTLLATLYIQTLLR